MAENKIKVKKIIKLTSHGTYKQKKIKTQAKAKICLI